MLPVTKSTHLQPLYKHARTHIVQLYLIAIIIICLLIANLNFLWPIVILKNACHQYETGSGWLSAKQCAVGPFYLVVAFEIGHLHSCIHT